MRATIVLADIHFSYNGQQRAVFDGLTLAIPAGSVTAILGPNGAGKSTLLQLILGVLTPTSGTILLDDRPRGHYTRREIGRLMGLVSQSETIPFSFTVLEYVLLGRAPYLGLLETPGPEDLRMAQAALAQVGLAEMAGRSIQALSGGERQLVTIARALAQQPRILLLDEPTAHLDLSNKGRIMEQVHRQAEAGVTVVFTTHEPDLVAKAADHLILMRAGETLAAGPLAEIFTSDALSRTYGVPVSVAEIEGRRVVLT